MDYKEKIRLAKEALDSGSYDKDTIEYIFPELAESEDEKIRKALIDYFNGSHVMDTFGGISWDSIVAWLKEQGEHAKFRDSIQVGDKVTRNQDGVLVNLSQLKRVAKPSDDIDTEKQGEQPVEWNEEDEKMYTAILRDVRNGEPLDKLQYDWLKSIKDRVQPKQEWKQENTGDLTDFENAMMHIGGSFFGQHQGLDPNDTSVVKEQAKLLLELIPSKEWSEEDKRSIRDSIFYLKSAKKYFEKDDDILWDEKWFNLCIKWLESLYKMLRPQNTWKPSDEQIIELRRVISGCSYDIEPLVEIEEQLKKLREE